MDILSLKDLGISDTWQISLAFPKIHWNLLQTVFLSAFAISLLAILEVFSIARAISIKSAETLRINQQVFGLGVSNFLLAFFPAAMPTSGSLSRSWLNFFNGAKTRFSALFSGLFIFLFSYVGWIWIRYIPLVTLSAILFVVIWQMIDWESIKHCIKTTIEDRVVFFLTMISCLLFSLDIAFYIGITLSIIFFLKKASEPFIVEYGFNKAGRLKILSSRYRRYRNIRIIGMGGELFFATVDFIQDAMLQIADDPYVQAIILKLNSIYHMDASMALALLQLHAYLQGKNKLLVISGVTKPVYETMLKAEIVQKIGFEHIFLTDETKPQLSTWRAYLYAEGKIENLS
jgi:SulP family sulfate permease